MKKNMEHIKKIGNVLLGTPKDLGMPDDIHAIPVERARLVKSPDDWKGTRNQLAVNTFRLNMTVHSLKRMRTLNLWGGGGLLLLATLLTIGTSHGGARYFDLAIAVFIPLISLFFFSKSSVIKNKGGK